MISYYTKEREEMVNTLVGMGWWFYMMEGQNGIWMPPHIPRYAEDRTPEQQAEAQRRIISKCGASRDFYMNAEITLREAGNTPAAA